MMKSETPKSKAHLYLFSDACPSDWLEPNKDDRWHTIVNFYFQSDPNLLPLIEKGCSHEDVLPQDVSYNNFISTLQSKLRLKRLQKWKSQGDYKKRFCQAFSETVPSHMPIISVCSYQEETLRASKAALLRSYNSRIGGIDGRGIGFVETPDKQGRIQMTHSFVNMNGLHTIKAPENKLLVLLMMSWFAADQYSFFFNQIAQSGQYGFNDLGLTIVSDMLSGDNDERKIGREIFKNLIDPDGEGASIDLTRSSKSDNFSGDLLVDNLAGWLNAAISDPTSEYAGYAKDLISTGVWTGWHQLVQSNSELDSIKGVSRLVRHA